MRLICPSCGAVASLEAWVNEAVARELVAEIGKLPPPLPGLLPHYLALFRPEQRALKWPLALVKAQGFAALVATGHAQVQGKPARPCPPRIWGQALEYMLTRTDIRRPLKNHNYLRQVAWDLADQADMEHERDRNEIERNGGVRMADGRGMACHAPTENTDNAYAAMSEADWQRLPEAIKRANADSRIRRGEK